MGGAQSAAGRTVEEQVAEEAAAAWLAAWSEDDAGGKRAVGERQREAARACGEIVEGLLYPQEARGKLPAQESVPQEHREKERSCRPRSFRDFGGCLGIPLIYFGMSRLAVVLLRVELELRGHGANRTYHVEV